MVPETVLAREIARIANRGRFFDYRLRADKRGMTPDETRGQLGHSAWLLKAVPKHSKKIRISGLRCVKSKALDQASA